MIANLLSEPALRIAALPILWLLCTLVGWLAAAPLEARAPRDATERLGLYWIMGTAVVSWVGSLLGFYGAFQWQVLLICLGLLVVWRLAWQWKRRGDDRAAPTMEAPAPALASVAAAILLVAAGWLYARPAESYLLTDDSAVYTLSGVSLARQGSLWFQVDPILIPGDQDDGEFWENPQEYTPIFDEFMRQFGVPSRDIPIFTRQYGPFYHSVLYLPSVEIGFLPLPKVWAGLCTLLFGAAMAPWAVAFWGVTALAMVYFLTRRLFGWPTALASLVLLGISFPQVWFSRLHLSEAYAQACIWGGLWIVALAHQYEIKPRTSHWLAAGGGILMGTLSIIRFEALAVILPLVAVLWWRWQGTHSHSRWRPIWTIMLGICTLVGTALSMGTAPYYYFTRVQGLIRATGVQLPLLGVIVLCASGLLLYRSSRLRQILGQITNRIPVLILLAYCAWCFISCWHLVARDWTQCLAGWLVQYWSWPGLAASMAGGIMLLMPRQGTRIRPETHAAWATGTAFLLLFAIHPLVSPIHPWAMRRIVPLVMPLLAISAAWFLTRGLRILVRHITSTAWTTRWAWAGYVAIALLVGGQAWLAFQPTRVVLHHQERRGLWGQLEAFADRFPPNALLLFNNGAVGSRLPQVMEMAFGLPSLVLLDTEAVHSDSVIVDRLIESALDAGRPVYFCLADASADWHSPRWRLTSVGNQRFETPVVAYAKGRPPLASDLATHIFWADIYAVSAAPSSTARVPENSPSESFVVPAGSGSYPYLRSGFYGQDVGVGERPVRWTEGHAEIIIPAPVGVDGPQLELEIAGGRAPGRQPAHLTVRIEDQVVFDGELPTGFEPYRIALPLSDMPRDGRAEWCIELDSTIWVPDPSGDDRELGVLFYSLALCATGECP